MNNRLSSTIILSGVLVVILVAGGICADYYVDASANGSNSGTSWADAFLSIQAGIDACSGQSPDTVQVAEATYIENITLKSYVALLGGYPSGGGTRDSEANPTIIDGGGDGSVVWCDSVTASGIDGFTIENGHSAYGGGIYCFESSFTVANNTFTGNSATYGGAMCCLYDSLSNIERNTFTGNQSVNGGGIYCARNSSPTIEENVIAGNHADGFGGGVACYIDSSPTISNNTIRGNSASYTGGGISCWYRSCPAIDGNSIAANSCSSSGGGISCWYRSCPTINDNSITGNSVGSYHGGAIYCYYDSSPIVTGNTIAANSARWYGGGICCEYGCSPVISNNLIVVNSADRSGGGIYCFYNSSLTLTNCTIADNEADSDANGYGTGGAIYVADSSSQLGVLNCILWGDSPNEIAGETADVVIEYSDVQGGWAGTGNISADPLFADSTDGDYSLLSGSPCIDAGFSTGAPEYDMVGNPRVDDPHTKNSGAGDNGDYYDMGALERQGQESSCDYNSDGEEDSLYDVIEGIKEMGLHHGIEKSLIKKIENAQKSFDKGNTKAGCNKLNAFLNHVEAQRGKKLTEDQADLLHDWICCVSEVSWYCGLCD